MDFYLFQKINGLVYVSKILDWMGIFLADYFQYILVTILLVFLFWPQKDIIKNRLMVLSAAISVVLSRLVITEIIRFFYQHPRPNFEDFDSFPSGHAAFFFALAMGVWFFNKKLGVWFFIGAILMGIARIFVGVHWPSDILAGAVIGIVSAIIVYKFIPKRKIPSSSL